ncbi:hypothetical protein VOLCADRAFT_88573 [Volvox carteri f. nagariensis]|uniref:Uncharacterized protein n=1 Tax=Volvox carteri f. nagariensis TaxID=3068 RepID=D8TPC9_VOLCA|nr:uncharacterized protein VOLCADRAFT_88573 [Volvox carteri f. nagariensis]EFJ50740.1 hypothetical protein VOLCADRAFT_88573 [Volvox carteri f. nagariensis]|eukprot:XP_002948333.1 hypothetical protein VOLCADRAFT_88573 [Volvox carteri f. nagariensis]
MVDVAGAKDGYGAVSPASDTKLWASEPKAPNQKTATAMDIEESQCLEQDAMPERPASIEPEAPVTAEAGCPVEPDRPVSAESDNPARAAFRARFSARSPDDMTPSPITFKSSRSLNRSIGVRRRNSDPSSNLELILPPLAAATVNPTAKEDDYPDDAEEEDQGPDPLREQFELTKETNPLLAIGRKATSNGILSCKASERSMKSLKSHKRLAVGFALADGASGVLDRPASSGHKSDSTSSRGTGDLDPDDHMEAERFASESSMPAEVPAPVVVQ